MYLPLWQVMYITHFSPCIDFLFIIVFHVIFKYLFKRSLSSIVVTSNRTIRTYINSTRLLDDVHAAHYLNAFHHKS